MSWNGVDTDGCGTGPGNPCLTLAHALARSKYGHTILIDGSSKQVVYTLCTENDGVITIHGRSLRGYNGMPRLGCPDVGNRFGEVSLTGSSDVTYSSNTMFLSDIELIHMTVYMKDVSLYIVNTLLYNVSLHNSNGCNDLKLYIRNSTFRQVSACPHENHVQCGTVDDKKLVCKSISVFMENTFFSDTCFNIGGLYYAHVNVQSCTFTREHGINFDTGMIGGIKVHLPSVNGSITVRDSLFENLVHTNPIFSAINIDQSALRVDVRRTDEHIMNVSALIQDSVFRGNERGLSMTQQMSRVLVERCRFEDNTAMHAAAAIRLALSTDTEVMIRSCIFTNNAAGSSPHQQQEERFWYDGDQVRIESKCVKGIISLVGKGGAIRVNKAKVTLWNCTFINNTARLLGGALYIDRLNEIKIIDSHFENSDSNVHSMQGDIIYSSGRLAVDNTVFFVQSSDDHTSMIRHSGDHWSMETGSLWFQCPVGHRLHYVNSTSHKVEDNVGLIRSHKLDQLLYYCKICGDNQYSLDYGYLNFTLLNNQTEYHTLLINGKKPFKYHAVDFVYGNISCHECPYGAKCDSGIVSVPSFWGYKDRSLAYFQHCPDDYCCTTRVCYQMDGCASNREGRLCGMCKPGFTEALFSPRCVSNDKCGNSLIWPSIGIIGLVYTIFLIFQGDVKIFIFSWGKEDQRASCNQNCHCCAKVASNADTELVQIGNTNGTCGPVDLETVEENGEINKAAGRNEVLNMISDDHTDAITPLAPNSPDKKKDDDKNTGSNGGFLITLFYYFQDALLLHINTVYTKTVSKFQKQLKAFLLGFFRFRLDFYLFMDDICLFPNLQPVPKNMYKALFVAYIILIFGIIYMFHKCWRYYRPKPIPDEEGETGSPDSTLHSNKRFSSKLAGGFVLAFMFTYQKMATTTFTLLNCVPIGNETVLFIDGTQTCFQSWQYGVVAYACACVLPFSVVLMVGPPLLKNGHISLTSFFCGCTLPLPTLIMWLAQYLTNKSRRNRPGTPSPEVASVLEIVEGPFKEPQEGRVFSQLCWSGVLTGRRLILFLCFTFINDVLVRLLCMLAVCFSILLHHVYVRPYNSRLGNLAGALSAAALLVVGGINLLRASFEVAEYVPMGPNRYLMEVCEELENTLLLWLPLAGMCILMLLLIFRLLCICVGQLQSLFCKPK